MRRFIYLDTDTLNSYLAQMFDGLIQSQSEEMEDMTGKEKQNGAVHQVIENASFRGREVTDVSFTT